MEDDMDVYSQWRRSAIDYLKIQDHDIPGTYKWKPVKIWSKTYLVYGKGVYLFGEEDDYFDNDTELIVLNVAGGNWSVLTDEHQLAQYRAYLIKRHLRIKGRPCIVGSCMVCGHVIPSMLGPCTENCPCCPPYDLSAPTPLENK
ncbi:hypothetical protein H4R27_003611 [Coemansia aciculifera]|nr:hypothetical protein H4R27_003611 [Coemansia aciculifera]